MFISELIMQLHLLKHNKGDLEVCAWHYGGGDDDLMMVKPVHDEKLNMIIMQPDGEHESKARR